jgi:hypothetical protein
MEELAMTDALAGIGTLLKRGDGGSPETFITIAKVKDINGPTLTTDVVDVTSQDSPGHTEEIIPTLKRPGEITTTIHYLPTESTHNEATGVLGAWDNRTKSNYKIVWPDSGLTTWSLAGFITRFTPKAPVAGALTADITVRLSGNPTLV